MPALRTRLPQVLTFGVYDAATRTGPALWLRAAAARQVPGLEWPASDPPVIYLPGSRPRRTARRRGVSRRAATARVVRRDRRVLWAAQTGARLDAARLSRGARQPGLAERAGGQGDPRGARACRRPPVRRAARLAERPKARCRRAGRVASAGSDARHAALAGRQLDARERSGSVSTPSPPSPRRSWASTRARSRGRTPPPGWPSARKAGPRCGTGSRKATAATRAW